MSMIYIQGEEEKKRRIHYEVDPSLPPLGEGGMGQVLRGVRVDDNTKVRQNVAIKFLFEDLPQHAIERARREASIQIHNENLVEMFGFIEIADNNGVKRYHVVSELLEGVMLFDLLNGKTTDKYGCEVEFAKELYHQYQTDKFKFSTFIVRNILSGLMALHDKGYIHRDLDPSNIMITHDRKVKIIDFGIAKQLNSLNTQDQQLTSTGQFVGKASYAAPELVLGDVHNQDKTTDIYAVGIMLYQFIVGSLPFEGTMAELIKKQVNDKIPLGSVPYKGVRQVIGKATRKKQSERYQSAAEMRVDLEHLKNESDGGTVDKKKTGIIAGIAAGILAVAGLVFTFSNSGPSQEEINQMRKDSLFHARDGKVLDSSELEIIVDEESGAKMTPISKLIADALNIMDDSTHIKEGVGQLEEIISKYGDYKYSAKAYAILAALTQPQDVSITTDHIKKWRSWTNVIISRDEVKAHRYAKKSVENDPMCYQGLYELGWDYGKGMPRTGEDNLDAQKAYELFSEGLNLAREQNDQEYIKIFEQLKDATKEYKTGN